MEYKSRNDVPEKYRCKLDDFFATEEEFYSNLKETNKSIENLKNDNIFKNAIKLYNYINDYINCIRLLENLYVYAQLINDQELGNSKSIEKLNEVLILNNKFEVNTSFFMPELLKLNEKEYNSLFEKEPQLKEYKIYLDRIYREKKHILNESEEKIISELTNSMNHYEEISSTLINSEHNYGKIKLSDGEIKTISTNNYRKLSKDKDENVRKKLSKLFNKTLDQYGATNASLLNSFIKMNNSISEIRHYESPWDEKLFGLNLSNKVFESLVSTTESNLNILQSYYDLKRRVLNLDKLHQYDLNLEPNECDTTYTIEEAQQISIESIKPLGEDYVKHFKKIFDNNYVDYCQYKGKISGGYSISSLDKDSRIMMSYNGDLDSISTIIHEGGHNVHHQYISENSPLHYRSVSPLVCEVASLTNECLLSHYISTTSKTKEERLSGLANIMRVIVSNLFGAVREGKMEQDMYELVHNGGSITKEYMDNLTMKSLKKYYGNKVILNNNSKNSWINRSHYYMNFYLYSYAICISVATNVAQKIIDGDESMLDKYKKFLSTGSNVWPQDAFKILDIDIENPSVYQNAINYFNNLIMEYKKLIEVK